MNHATLTNSMINTMADIQFPSPPNWQALLLIIILTALTAALVGWYRWREKPQADFTELNEGSVLTQLNSLEQDWSTGVVSQRSCAYQLASLLRKGLQLPQLDHEPPLCAQHNPQQWRDMILLLQQCRYPEKCPDQLNSLIFEQIRILLSLTPGYTKDNQSHAFV